MCLVDPKWTIALCRHQTYKFVVPEVVHSNDIDKMGVLRCDAEFLCESPPSRNFISFSREEICGHGGTPREWRPFSLARLLLEEQLSLIVEHKNMDCSETAMAPEYLPPSDRSYNSVVAVHAIDEHPRTGK